MARAHLSLSRIRRRRKYLWALRFDPRRKREIYGRHGSDFIGIVLNAQGEITRVIVGEAKWRASLTDSVVDNPLFGPKEENEDTGKMVHNGRGIWFKVNRPGSSNRQGSALYCGRSAPYVLR
jgi:hypothetical protein